MTRHMGRAISTCMGAAALAVCVLTSAPAAAQQRQADPGTAPAATNVLFAEEPAILIVIEGDPVYRPLKGTDLQRLTNTRPFIVRDGAGIYYLKVLDGWMEAYELTGLWSVAGVPPAGALPALRRAAASGAVDLMTGALPGRAGQRPTLDGSVPPAIFVTTKPSVLIVMDGPPRYATVEGSSLEFVENTVANVFKEPTDDQLYVLTAGGWLRAWTTDGPWESVPRNELPADIAAIPADSPVWHRTPESGVVQPKR
jgi:hypothetical protein